MLNRMIVGVLGLIGWSSIGQILHEVAHGQLTYFEAYVLAGIGVLIFTAVNILEYVKILNNEK